MSGLFDANGKFRPLQWTLMLWFRDFHEDLQSIERAAANLSAITHIQLNSNHDNVFDEAEGTELVDAFSKIVETKNTWNGVKITNMSDHCINPWVAPMLLCLFENAITVDNVTIIGRDPDERIPFFEAIQKGVHKVAKLNLTLCSLSPALVRILSAGLTIGPEIPTTIVFPSNKGISDSTTVDALAEEIYKWNRVKKLDFMFSQLSNDDIQTMVTGLCRAGNDSQLTCLLLPAETHLNTCVLNSLGTLIRTSPSLEGLCCKMIIVDNDSSSNVDCTEFSQALAHPSTRLEWINMGGEISSANYVLLADAMATNRWMKNLSADLPRGSSDFALMETLQALRCALEQNKKSSLITVSAESRSFEGSIIYRALLGREFLREGPRE